MSQTAALLDHRGQPIQTAVARVAPSKREMARQIKARYDAAQTNDENRRHWANADSLSPNAALDPRIRRVLRNRARYECANNTFAAGMIATLANDTIGTGPKLQVLTKSAKDNREIRRLFMEWACAVRLPQKLRTMRMAKARDGEAFASLGTNMSLRCPVKMDIYLHEAEMIASPDQGVGTSSVYDGILFDDFGNPAAYQLLRQHPGDSAVNGMPGDYDLIPAADMIHLFNCDRPGQYRGAPEITPALPLYAQLRRYTLAVIRCAESAAIPSWVLQTNNPPEIPFEGTPFDTVETERGMGMTLPEGWQMGQIKAEQPTGTYAEFKKQIISEIARCLNMPYGTAAGDSSSYNYSSARLDRGVYATSIRVERSYTRHAALDVMFSRWWEEAVLIRGYLPAKFYRSQKPVPEHNWNWDGEDHIDPVKDATALDMALSNHTTTLARYYASRGEDWQVELEQRSREVKLMQSLGLIVDLKPEAFGDVNDPKAKSAQPAKPASIPNESDDAEEDGTEMEDAA